MQQHDLGVLFVHGIGERKQAETLLACGEAIQEWLAQWLEGGLGRFGMPVVAGANVNDSRTTSAGAWPPPPFYAPLPLPGIAAAPLVYESACLFDRAALLPPLVADAPAHAELTLSFAPGFGARPRRWLFAESWWGSQTITPDISDFLGWLVTRGPWIVLLHLHQRILRRNRPAWRQILLGAAAFPVWFMVSNLLVIVWIVVSLAALIPIGRWRAAVYDVLHRLAGVVGDSYDFVRAPMQRAAFVSATLSGLTWLQPRCGKIVVMAHSQGVSVAHEALCHPAAPKVDRFVSYGAGLAKLRAMQIVEAATPGRAICAGIAAPVLAVALLWVFRLVQLQLDAASYFFSGPALLAVGGFICLYFAWHSVTVTLQTLRESSHPLSLRERQPGVVWRDYYATHDPVPNGSLSDSIRVPELHSRAVTVLRSLWNDHTSYWKSRPGFVAAVVRELDRADGARLFTPDAVSQLRAVRHADSRRVRWYAWIRYLEVIAVLAVLSFGGHRLIAAGAEIREWIADSPLSSVGGVLKAVDAALAWFATDILAVSDPDVTSISNILLCGAILYVLWRIWRNSYGAVWAWWRDLVLERLFLSSYALASRMDNGFVSCIVLALGAMPIVLAALWLMLPAALGEVGLHRAFGLVGAMIVTLFGLLVLREPLIGFVLIVYRLRESKSGSELAKSLFFAFVCLLIVALAFTGLAALWSITIVHALVGIAVFVLPVAIALSLALVVWRLAHDARIPLSRRRIALPLPWVGWIVAAWFGWGVLDPAHAWLAISLGAVGGLAAAFVAKLIIGPAVGAGAAALPPVPDPLATQVRIPPPPSS